MSEIRHNVIGTAGHVDHGKTSLVRALTGVDCDRLEAEKARGITIELGFATWKLSENLHASIVDVPGHERFVRTMVAGASGLDAVMLVVAADDGVMPQTTEHLRVCELLGVQRGLIVINKADLVDAEMIALVKEDVRQLVDGTFLQQAKIVVCSAHSGQGIDELRQTMRALLDASPARRADGPAFLSIDRVFHKAGFGSVVTGTLLSGSLHQGDPIELIPGPHAQALPLRVRGLHIQDQPVTQAQAGVRLAINLRGPEAEALRRGAALITPGWQSATRALHVALHSLANAPLLKDGSEVFLHLGTHEQLARLHPLGEKHIAPGRNGLARLVAEQDLVAFAGQRFVLRQPGRHGIGTIAGGRVLDPHPASGKGSYQRWQKIAQALQQESLEQRLLALLQDARQLGASAAELVARLPPGEKISKTLAALRDRQQIFQVAGNEARFVHPEALDSLGTGLVKKVQSFHQAHPVLPGVSVNELSSQLPTPARWLCELALARLVKAQRLRHKDGLYQHPDHSAGDDDKRLQKMALYYSQAGLIAPNDDEAREHLQMDARLFRDGQNALIRSGQLVRLAQGLHCDRAALDAITVLVRKFFTEHTELSPRDLKAMQDGLSRKYAIPILEWLDANKVTMRKGSARVLR